MGTIASTRLRECILPIKNIEICEELNVTHTERFCNVVPPKPAFYLSILSFSCCQSRAVEKLGEMTKLEEKIHLHWISTSLLEV